MTALLDTNVLVYLLREEAPEHVTARRWLAEATKANDDIRTTSVALAGLVRLASSPKIFASPDLRRAFGFIDALTDRGLGLSEPGPRHWRLFRELCLRHDLSGNEVPDAYLAAVAIEIDATLVTRDRGFDRFPSLQTLDPLAA